MLRRFTPGGQGSRLAATWASTFGDQTLAVFVWLVTASIACGIGQRLRGETAGDLVAFYRQTQTPL